jgi:hypothetical protein
MYRTQQQNTEELSTDKAPLAGIGLVEKNEARQQCRSWEDPMKSDIVKRIKMLMSEIV